MPAYMIEIEHRPTDQVFSYYHGESLLHFNVTLLARLHKQMPAEFRRITMDITDQEYDLCMKHRGIEEPKVERLQGKHLREPGYGVLFEEGTFTMVDGHHRVVRRYRGGIRVMDFYVTYEPVWRQCLIEYTEEGEERIKASLPERVGDPPVFGSRVAVHPEGS